MQNLLRPSQRRWDGDSEKGEGSYSGEIRTRAVLHPAAIPEGMGFAALPVFFVHFNQAFGGKLPAGSPLRSAAEAAGAIGQVPLRFADSIQ